MTLSTPTSVYLGRTSRNELVFAGVRIEPVSDTKMVTFIDHSTGLRPEEIAISFTLIQPYADERNNLGKGDSDYPDNRWLGSGQVPAGERRLAVLADPAVRIVERAWEQHHLNLTKAACVHMSESSLTPSEDELSAYMEAKVAERGEWREKYSPAFYGRSDALQKWRLNNVVCATTGYKYGHAWLAEKVDADEVEELRDAVSKLPKAVR